MPDILVVLVVVVLVFWIFSGSSPTWGRYSPSFQGANILWTVLVVLAIIYLLRHLF